MKRRLTIFGCGVITGMMTSWTLPLILKKSCLMSNDQEKHADTKDEQNRQMKDMIIDEAMNLSKTMKTEVGKLIKQVETLEQPLKKNRTASKNKSSNKN